MDEGSLEDSTPHEGKFGVGNHPRTRPSGVEVHLPLTGQIIVRSYHDRRFREGEQEEVVNGEEQSHSD